LILVGLYRLFPDVRGALTIVKPDTVIRCGIDVGPTGVAKYMAQLGDPHERPPSKTMRGPGAPEPSP
jgi:hypothetical protein